MSLAPRIIDWDISNLLSAVGTTRHYDDWSVKGKIQFDRGCTPYIGLLYELLYPSHSVYNSYNMWSFWSCKSHKICGNLFHQQLIHIHGHQTDEGQIKWGKFKIQAKSAQWWWKEKYWTYQSQQYLLNEPIQEHKSHSWKSSRKRVVKSLITFFIPVIGLEFQLQHSPQTSVQKSFRQNLGLYFPTQSSADITLMSRHQHYLN